MAPVAKHKLASSDTREMAIEPDMKPAVDRGEGIAAMQPMKIGEGGSRYRDAVDLALELTAKSAAFRSSLPPAMRTGLADLAEFFDFSLPTHATSWKTGSREQGAGSQFSWDATGCRTDCSWFGFMLRVKASAPFSHTDLGRHLDQKKIGNRMLFGGNLLRQPAFVQLRKDRPQALRVIGAMPGADELMQRALFLGTYPGLTSAMLDYEIQVIHDFVRSR